MSTIRATYAGPSGTGTTTNLMSGLAKAWVIWATTPSTAIGGSYNVSSLTDNATADTTINATNAFTSLNYSSTFMGGEYVTAWCISLTLLADKTTSAYRLYTGNQSFAAADNKELNITHVGTLA